MRFILAGIALGLALGAGCGKDESKTQVSRVQPSKPSTPASDAAVNMSAPSAFHRDIHKICNAESLSGANEMENGYNRAMTVAKWLGENLRTPEGRRFLGETARLGDPRKKAKALAAQAEKSGVASCPLVKTWSGDPAPTKKTDPADKTATGGAKAKPAAETKSAAKTKPATKSEPAKKN